MLPCVPWPGSFVCYLRWTRPRQVGTTYQYNYVRSSIFGVGMKGEGQMPWAWARLWAPSCGSGAITVQIQYYCVLGSGSELNFRSQILIKTQNKSFYHWKLHTSMFQDENNCFCLLEQIWDLMEYGYRWRLATNICLLKACWIQIWIRI